MLDVVYSATLLDAIQRTPLDRVNEAESEVIRDGLRALLARDRAVESWLHNQVGLAYEALKADSSQAVTVNEVRVRLAAAEHVKAR